MDPIVIYLPPFNRIKERMSFESIDEKLYITTEYKFFQKIIQDFLRLVPVDQEWYLKQYPDVVQAGMSAREHFAEHGYFEGRLPAPLTVDEGWYLKANPDVADQIAAGDMPDALTHFREHGYAEGRLPRAL